MNEKLGQTFSKLLLNFSIKYLLSFITQKPSPPMIKMGWALRALLISDSSSCLKDRKVSGRLIRKCAPGTELVDWLMNLSPVVHTRIQGAGMWQALLEEGVISHGEISLFVVCLFR